MKNLAKILALIILFLVVASSSALSQKNLADKSKVDDLTKKITECKMKISRLNMEMAKINDYSSEVKKIQAEIDSINKIQPLTNYGQTLKSQTLEQKNQELQKVYQKQSRFTSANWKRIEVDSLSARLKRYEREKNRIFETYIADKAIPEELSPREKNRRERGLIVETKNRKEVNQARLEELGFKKMDNSSVKADSINGYEGFVWNLSTRSRITFKIYSVDDYGMVSNVETISFFTSPGERKTHHLLPGNYHCDVFREGYKIGVWDFKVTPQLHYALGEQTHWQVHREGY